MTRHHLIRTLQRMQATMATKVAGGAEITYVVLYSDEFVV